MLRCAQHDTWRPLSHSMPLKYRLERVYHLGGDTLEGFGILNILSPGNAARMVGAVLCDVCLVLVQVALRPHRLHGLQFERENRADIDKDVGNEAAVFRLVRLEEKEFWRLDGRKTAGDA